MATLCAKGKKNIRADEAKAYNKPCFLVADCNGDGDERNNGGLPRVVFHGATERDGEKQKEKYQAAFRKGIMPENPHEIWRQHYRDKRQQNHDVCNPTT